MKRFMVKTGKSPAGRAGYALEMAPDRQRRAPAGNPASQPVSRQDILNLQEALVWPPVEMRDVNLTEMEKQRRSLNSVWEDPNLDPTSKLLRASLHSQLFAVANKKYFSRGEPGAANLPSSYQSPPPPLTPAQESADATAQDQKQTFNLIPRLRGTPLSLDMATRHVPEHNMANAKAMAMSLMGEDSPVSWDDQGKIIRKGEGARGKGLVVKGSNIQDILSYATNPSPLANPPKGYSTIRDALITQGKNTLISSKSETYFNEFEKEAAKKLKQMLPTPPTSGRIKAKIKSRRTSTTPYGRQGTKVVSSKLRL